MKLVFCIINAQIDQTKRQIEMCRASHNRNGNPKPKAETSKPENQNTSKTDTNPSTKSKSKSKSKTIREANANQNSKWNHIMTIAKRSDNAKCEIKFAFSQRQRLPLPLCPLLPTLNISTNNDRIGAPQMCCSCNKILHTCNGNLPLISLCTYFVATRRGEASHPALRGVYVLRSQARPCYAVLHWAGLGRTRPHRV